MPLTEICNREYSDPRQRQLFRNIIYVGALAALLDMDLAVIEKLIGEQFKGKDKLIAPNIHALHLGSGYAKANFDCPIGLRMRRASAVGDRIFIDGNSAAALGCVYGGATVAAWYPITPSSSLAEAFARHCRTYRGEPVRQEPLRDHPGRRRTGLDRHGDRRGVEWRTRLHLHLRTRNFADAGVRRAGLLRGDSRGDLRRAARRPIHRHADANTTVGRAACAYASHGDTKHVLLFPEDPAESFDFARRAFDIAERLQTPVFVMLDLDIGMNDRLSRPLAWDDARRYDRGKVVTFEALESGKEFGRYLDVDGDGITYRTYPGTHPSRGSFFTRGTTKDRYARYSEAGPDYLDNMQRLLRKFETAKDTIPKPVVRPALQPSRLGVIYYGSTSPAMHEALDILEQQGPALRCDAPASLSLPRPGGRFHCRARPCVRGRTKPRRTIAHAAGQRMRNRSGTAYAGAALRRHADHRAFHRQGNRRGYRRT